MDLKTLMCLLYLHSCKGNTDMVDGTLKSEIPILQEMDLVAPSSCAGDGGHGQLRYMVTPKGRVHIMALLNAELPTQKWVSPFRKEVSDA